MGAWRAAVSLWPGLLLGIGLIALARPIIRARQDAGYIPEGEDELRRQARWVRILGCVALAMYLFFVVMRAAG
jgi:hypothetical protein